jgi:CDP-diacylglycerol--glycerol-3-phosphate 3-phosphatidyltransferase
MATDRVSLGPFWTASNVLSLLRAVLALPVGVLLWYDIRPGLTFTLMMLAVLTDWLDGYLARMYRLQTGWGKALDPLADKFAAIVVLVVLTVQGRLPIWFIGLMLGRDVILVAGAFVIRFTQGFVPVSRIFGKIATVCIALLVIAEVLHLNDAWVETLLYTSALFLILSFIQYAVRFTRLMRPNRPDTDAQST